MKLHPLFALLSLFALKAYAAGKPTTIHIDGSSTVFPISEAVAEEYAKADRSVRVTVGVSGTGGGGKKFIAKEISIWAASRPVADKELEQLKTKKIEFVELPIAYDALSVVVSKQNTFVKAFKVADLKKLWEPGSKIKSWKDLDSSYPDKPVKLFGPGADSGTFDYFTEKVVGKAKSSRKDYEQSEDDNVLVKGVATSPFSLAYFGHSYAVNNADKLRAIPLDEGKGAVAPEHEAIRNQTYPLSRLLFLYVNKSDLEKDPKVAAFVDFYLKKSGEMANAVGYLSLTDKEKDKVYAKFQKKTVGTTGKI